MVALPQSSLKTKGNGTLPALLFLCVCESPMIRISSPLFSVLTKLSCAPSHPLATLLLLPLALGQIVALLNGLCVVHL